MAVVNVAVVGKESMCDKTKGDVEIYGLLEVGSMV